MLSLRNYFLHILCNTASLNAHQIILNASAAFLKTGMQKECLSNVPCPPLYSVMIFDVESAGPPLIILCFET